MNGRTNSNNNTTGLEIEVPLDPVTNVSASAGNGQVELTWTDPLDKYAATEGEVAESPNPIVSQWDHTRVVRKENTQPTGPNDGMIVVDSTVKNQYMSEPFVDTGLTNGSTYYYGAFACSAAGAWSDGTFVSAVPVAGTPLGNLVEGTLITIKENGAPVEFYVADHDYQSDLNGDGRTLMVRKDLYDSRQWNSGNVNFYNSSTIDAWLNQTYLKFFSAPVKEKIGTTSFYYTKTGAVGKLATLTRSVFILSNMEFGFSNTTYYFNEGERVPIYSTLRRAKHNGEPSEQWTRTAPKSETSNAYYITSGGQSANQTCIYYACSRPCFTLPATALVDPSNALIES